MRARRSWPLWALALALTALVASPLCYLVLRWPDGAGAVLARSSTWSAVGRSTGLAVMVALACVTLAVPLAWLTHATDLPGRRAFRILLVLPLAVPSYVGGFVVIATFAPGGFWPVIDPYSGAGAFIALLFTYPLAYLAVQATLERLDPRLWESARSLGCSPAAAFLRLVLPQLRPAMAGGALLVGLYAIGDFGAVSLTRYESLSYLVYLRFKSLFARGEAVPLSLLLVALSALLAFLVLLFGGKSHRALRSQRRAWPVISLGRWRWPAFGLCAAVVAAGVALPIAVVVGWLLRGIRLENDILFPAGELGNSLLVSSIAAVSIVAVAFVPTLFGRYAMRGAGAWMRVVAHLGYALPGIVVALAVVALVTSYAFPLYQTLTLLLLAYAIRFLPLAANTLDDAVGAQDPNLFWAARSLGCGPFAAWRRAILPGTWPAVVAGALAVFIAVIKELPVTLILSPIEFATLATRIWSLTEDAYFAAVSPSVLLLVGAAMVALLLRPDVRRRGLS